MALYAIGDLHLSLKTNKPMDVFGGNWIDYTEKIKKGFRSLNPDDVCVLCGDLSWGMNMEDSLEDLIFIDNLPGKKIIIKGNHDYWWDTVSKMKAFFAANNIINIEILHNNSFIYENTAICGTRGWQNDDGLSSEQNKKITAREVLRLKTSLSTAPADLKKICFFHYPPYFKNTIHHDIISLMQEYDVKKCYYGHLHGDGHRFVVPGLLEGIEHELVSADYTDFTPKTVRVPNEK